MTVLLVNNFLTNNERWLKLVGNYSGSWPWQLMSRSRSLVLSLLFGIFTVSISLTCLYDLINYSSYDFFYRYVHLHLCLISHKLNNLFKILMLVQLSWFFLKSVNMCAEIYEILLNRNLELWTFSNILDNLYDFTDFILHSILFFTLNYVCQTVYCKV